MLIVSFIFCSNTTLNWSFHKYNYYNTWKEINK